LFIYKLQQLPFEAVPAEFKHGTLIYHGILSSSVNGGHAHILDRETCTKLKGILFTHAIVHSTDGHSTPYVTVMMTMILIFMIVLREFTHSREHSLTYIFKLTQAVEKHRKEHPNKI